MQKVSGPNTVIKMATFRNQKTFHPLGTLTLKVTIPQQMGVFFKGTLCEVDFIRSFGCIHIGISQDWGFLTRSNI